MKPVYMWMNRLSLLCHALLACVINLVIEAISRHSLFQAWDYMVNSPLVFLRIKRCYTLDQHIAVADTEDQPQYTYNNSGKYPSSEQIDD